MLPALPDAVQKAERVVHADLQMLGRDLVGDVHALGHVPCNDDLAVVVDGRAAMSARGSKGICRSSSAETAPASASLSHTSTAVASLSCSAWLSRSAAT